MPLSLPLLPAHLSQLGFKPHMVGKWHLGHYKEEFTPTRQASVMLAKAMLFDEAIGTQNLIPLKLIQGKRLVDWCQIQSKIPRRGFSTHFGYWAGKEDYYDHSNKNSVISSQSSFNSSDRNHIISTEPLWPLATEKYQVVIVLCSSKNISGKLWSFFNLICVIVLCRLYYMGYITTIQCFMCYVNCVNIFVFSKLFKMCICKMNLYLHLDLSM